MQDEASEPRIAALEALAEKWPDETTRRMLAERAVNDEDFQLRRAALGALAKNWQDETTRKLLTESVGDPSLTGAQRAWFWVKLGKMHSEFGRILPTKDLDGLAPYLDPLRPISRKHIKQAAKKAGIPADRIDDEVRSLSEYLGWDITKGSAG